MSINILGKMREIGLDLAQENDLFTVEWCQGFHLAITEKYGPCHIDFSDKTAPSVKVTIDPEGAARATFTIRF